MQLDITEFFTETMPSDYSASVMEKGPTVARDTWQAAKDSAPDYNFLDTDGKRDAFRSYMKGFGVWNEEEIAAWDDTELNALLIQMISGDMRDGGLDASPIDWAKYEKDAESGRCSGRIFRGDDGRIYYYVGD